MKLRSNHEEIPDYLHDSPFFLPELHEFKSNRKPKRKPSLKEFLSSKIFRVFIYAILTIISLLYLRYKAEQVDVWGHLTGPSCYYKHTVEPPYKYGTNETDWSKFAYALYATDTEYLCNTVMLFEILHRMGSKADRILLYPRGFKLDAQSESINTELLLKAKEYGVKLIPIDVQHNNLASYFGPNWSDSYTKLLAFNQTQYTRLIVLDSDSTIYEPMDELFFLPPTSIALSRAYWLSKPTMSSHIMLITPSLSSFALIQAAIAKAKYGIYDMEIINRLFGSNSDCLRLPHRVYALLTGEFRINKYGDHGLYMDDKTLEWNPDAAIMEAKFVHFSDHPMQKPWLVSKGKGEKGYGYEPDCDNTRWTEGRNRDCRARNIWVDIYDDFKMRRKRVCEM